MLKSIKLGAVFFLCLFNFTVIAQKVKNNTTESEEVAEQKNIVKVNLPALAFKNISVEYERQVGKKSSVSINVHTFLLANCRFKVHLKILQAIQVFNMINLNSAVLG